MYLADGDNLARCVWTARFLGWHGRPIFSAADSKSMGTVALNITDEKSSANSTK